MSAKTEAHETTYKASPQNVVVHVESEGSVSSKNGHHRSYEELIQFEPPLADRADLPTFPMEFGWRTRHDKETGIRYRSPLTLVDLLFPTEDDIGVVTMAQSYLHDLWLNFLVSLFRSYLSPDKWLVTSDVLIFWHRGTATAKAPDIAAMLGGHGLDQENRSYHVGKHGPIPSFALEITSQDTRDDDLDEKRIYYAAMGIKEYLIIDIESPRSEDWALLGYRLGDSPYYDVIEPDADGGLTFETIGFRFTTTGRSNISVFDSASGERLLSLDDQKKAAALAEEATKAEVVARHQAEEAAKAEAAARHRAEEATAQQTAENEALRAEIERLKEQKG